jgi:CRISPR-associated exonuclease Cas4
MLTFIGLLCILLAIALYVASEQRQKSAGIPTGRLIYTDTRGWGELEEPLYDPEMNLVGKPDYLVENGGQIIPVEVKTSRPPDAPYDSHLYQLAAYCLLVQQVYGRRPPYGILHYNDDSGGQRTFKVDYTAGLEGSIRRLIHEMRQQGMGVDIARSHSSTQRCGSCGYRSICDQRL